MQNIRAVYSQHKRNRETLLGNKLLHGVTTLCEPLLHTKTSHTLVRWDSDVRAGGHRRFGIQQSSLNISNSPKQHASQTEIPQTYKQKPHTEWDGRNLVKFCLWWQHTHTQIHTNRISNRLHMLDCQSLWNTSCTLPLTTNSVTEHIYTVTLASTLKG